MTTPMEARRDALVDALIEAHGFAMSIEDVAALLKCSPSIVREGVRTKALPGAVIGTKYVVPTLAVARFLVGYEAEPEPEAVAVDPRFLHRRTA